MAAASLLAAAPAFAQQAYAQHGGRIGAGEPSEVITAEIAMARLAREKGDAAALKAYAAPDAQMHAIDAAIFLPALSNTAQALSARSAKLVWVSCDGSLAVTSAPLPSTSGVVTPNANRFYTTVWQRQRKGALYRFVLDMVTRRATEAKDRDFTEAHIAPCPALAHKPQKNQPPAFALKANDQLEGIAEDQSLSWSSQRTRGGWISFKLKTSAGQIVIEASDEAFEDMPVPRAPAQPKP